MSTDQIIPNKLTQAEKRGHSTRRASREYHNDRRNLDPVRKRPEDELVRAQRKLAELALATDNPAEWLSDVLKALGLHRVISAS